MEASSNGSEDCSWMYMPACSWMYMQVDGPHSKPMDGDIQCMEGGGDTVSMQVLEEMQLQSVSSATATSVNRHAWMDPR